MWNFGIISWNKEKSIPTFPPARKKDNPPLFYEGMTLQFLGQEKGGKVDIGILLREKKNTRRSFR